MFAEVFAKAVIFGLRLQFLYRVRLQIFVEIQV